MHYTILLVIVIVNEARCEREAKIQAHNASKWEIKKKLLSPIAYISCNSTPLVAPSHPFGDQWSEVIKVVLTGCYPPVLPNLPALAQSLAASGIASDNITHLRLREIPTDAKFNASHFEGLDSLIDLTIQAAGHDPPSQFHENFILSLPNVWWVRVENEALAPLQKNSIQTLFLERGRSLGSLGYCERLTNLRMREWRVPKGAEITGWLAECTNLVYLKAERLDLISLQTVLAGIGARELYSLEIPSNALTTQDLYYLMEKTVSNLQVLDVSDNQITDIFAYRVLETLQKLVKLDLSRNRLTDFINAVRGIFSSKKLRYSLKALILDYNPLEDYCNWDHNMQWLTTTGRSLPLNLNYLSLVGTNTTRVCFPDWQLYHLNISDNNMKELWFAQLPIFNNIESIIVDVRRNPLRDVHFNESDYNALTNVRRARSKKLIVHTDTLPSFDCTCKNAWLGRALREDLLVLPGEARCRDGSELRAAPPDSLECDQQTCQPCTCHRQWASNYVVMHCDNLGLQYIPSIPDIGELHLRGNQIDTIHTENLTSTLKLLDLRDNKIARLNALAAEALFDVLDRRVWLGGNPLVCDCDNWALLSALQVHSVQVEDFKNVTCSDGSSVDDLSQEQLCSIISSEIGVWLFAAGGASLGLLAVLGALYLRYNRQLKVWLYAHGWCLSCVREEELDADREYDAFLSFAHGDYEFVTEQLLPGLEDGPYGYKVCVHFRDWVPGEMIPTQITRSVTTSRRTIIVLSANFVQSMWGMVEFRAAHVSALEEGRVRVVVVALADTPGEEELPEELRMYMRSTTYLRWDDPWFWRKLRYAMPHRGTSQDKSPLVSTERPVHATVRTNAFEMAMFQPQ